MVDWERHELHTQWLLKPLARLDDSIYYNDRYQYDVKAVEKAIEYF